MNAFDHIEARLAELAAADQVTRELLSLNAASLLGDEAALLLQVDECDAVEWLAGVENAFCLLQAVIQVNRKQGSQPTLLVRLQRYLGDVDCPTADYLTDLLMENLACMTPELRSVVLSSARRGVEAPGFVEGRDFVRVRREPQPLSEPGGPRLPLDSAQGQLERLAAIGYRCSGSPQAREFGRRVLLLMFELDHGLPATGNPEAETLSYLDDLADASLG